MEIVAGEGGDDSKQFAHQLLALYQHFAASRELTAELIGVEGTRFTVQMSGHNVWQAFKNEPGNHVVQRVPENDRHGRVQTSIVAVMVLPLPPEAEQVSLPISELDVKFQPKGGPGGQHRNKTASACRMVHRPTGLAVFIDGRDQHANRRMALRILTARVTELRNRHVQDGYANLRASQWTGASRGEKTRTYRFTDSIVVDHRLGMKTGNIKAVMKGRLDLLGI